jgi:hypothetical protein
MARADRPGHSIGDAKLLEQRLKAGMHGFSGPVAAGPLTLAEDDAKSPRRAGDRGGGACRPAANDDYVGIDWSTRHASP